MLTDTIQKYERYVIYGAQVVGYGAHIAIKHLLDRSAEYFIVSNLKGNPSEIDGVAVKTLDAVTADTLVIVGVTELLQDEIVTTLQEKGYKHVFKLTQHEEYLLMSKYFESIGKFPILDVKTECTSVDLAMYEVKSHRDKPLGRHFELKRFEYSIQAGAAITAERIAPFLDNVGKNISAKNKQYCEMSATYWVWKNDNHDWKGIEHYRRHLLVEPQMLNDEIDAVLPLPYICYPNTLAQFRRFVSGDVLNALLHALKTLHPNEYDSYFAILNGKYQYTYNLVCAKSEIFDAYCEWFFNITEYMETIAGKAPEIVNTRALSYVAEVLTNLYFMSNQKNLKIKHAQKVIYT